MYTNINNSKNKPKILQNKPQIIDQIINIKNRIVDQINLHIEKQYLLKLERIRNRDQGIWMYKDKNNWKDKGKF